MKLLLTLPFTDELTPFDEAMCKAVLHERVLREMRYRKHVEEPFVEVALVQRIHGEKLRALESAPSLLLEAGSV